MQRFALAFLATALTACGSSFLWQLGLGSGAELYVERVQTRGPFLDVQLGGPLQLRIFAPATEPCTTVLAPEAQVIYVDRGWGRFERDDLSCDASGMGEPQISRARQPRSSSLRDSPIPREQSTFSVLHEDEEFVLLRGRFPLARFVGWAGGRDSIAVVANDELCQSAIEGGVASMEYRASGRVTLALVARRGLCPIVGLIRPPGA